MRKEDIRLNELIEKQNNNKLIELELMRKEDIRLNELLEKINQLSLYILQDKEIETKKLKNPIFIKHQSKNIVKSTIMEIEPDILSREYYTRCLFSIKQIDYTEINSDILYQPIRMNILYFKYIYFAERLKRDLLKKIDENTYIIINNFL
jgi:hypothetical protein